MSETEIDQGQLYERTASRAASRRRRAADLAPKTSSTAIGGALAVILTYTASTLGLDLPPEVAAAGATVLGFALSWLTRE